MFTGRSQVLIPLYLHLQVPISYPMTVTDANDNAPVFVGVPYYARISEVTLSFSIYLIRY